MPDVSQTQPKTHINYTSFGGSAPVLYDASIRLPEVGVTVTKREGRAPEVAVDGEREFATAAIDDMIALLTQVRDYLAPTAPKPQPVEPVTQVIPVEPCHGLRWGIGGEPVNDTNAVRRRAAAVRS